MVHNLIVQKDLEILILRKIILNAPGKITRK